MNQRKNVVITSKRMSFPFLITLAGNSASTRNYDLQSLVDKKALRANALAPASEYEGMTVSHTENTLKTGMRVKRHLVRLDLWKVSTSGEQTKAAVYVVMEVPVDPSIALVNISDMVTQLKNFLDAGAIAKLLNDEP